jgi:hypothetical protein
MPKKNKTFDVFINGEFKPQIQAPSLNAAKSIALNKYIRNYAANDIEVYKSNEFYLQHSEDDGETYATYLESSSIAGLMCQIMNELLSGQIGGGDCKYRIMHNDKVYIDWNNEDNVILLGKKQ